MAIPNIYTRTGDKGLTSLYGGKRVKKSDIRVEAYGTIDELNTVIGLVRAHLSSSSTFLQEFFQNIQNDLFVIGGYLAGSKEERSSLSLRVKNMEKAIDEMMEKVSPLRHFILPGGSVVAAHAHHARAVCRRAERRVIQLQESDPSLDASVIVFLNRLSDFLFAVARFANFQAGVADILWKR